MFDYPVVFVDIETTGGSYRTSRILEIGIIRVEHGKVVEEFNTILDPETYIPRNITSLTGISSADTHGKPTFSEVADEVASLMEGAVFIAHNVRFDYSFFKHEFALVGRQFTPKLLCTVRLSRALYPAERGHSLAKLIDRHKIPVNARHRALDDARAILYFSQLAFDQHGYEQFTDATTRQLKSQSLPPHLDSSQISVIKNIPGVYIFRDESHMPLYVGKSVELRKRVMSHFQSTDSKEVKISQQVHHIETIPTGSELAALLLESKLVKELQPIHNRLLRRLSLFAMLLRAEEGGYSKLQVQMGSIDNTTDLSAIYGIYRNRTAAKKKLDEVTRLFNLCPKLMGLEKTAGACFWYSLGRCKGACISQEPPELYNRRVEIALEHSRIAMWDYPSAVQVPINDQGERVVIENWIVRGFIDRDGEFSMSEIEPSFDVDEYKIVRRFLRENSLFVQPYEGGI